MIKQVCVSIFMCLLFISPIKSQEWKSTESAEYHKSVVKVTGGGYSGTGTVVKFIKDCEKYPEYYYGWVLTASHVIRSKETPIKIWFSNGQNTLNNVVIYKSQIDSGFDDLSLVKVLIPDTIKPMEMSSEEVPVGEKVELCGFGAGELRHWEATYAGSVYQDGGHIIFSWAIQGDSGGPIIYKGKVIGVICFGMGIKKYEDTRRMIVGPVYGSNVGKIKYKEPEETKPECNGGTVHSARKELYKNVTG